MREREIRSVSANYFAAARVAARSTRVSFYHAIWLAKEKTKVITSQKSFSGSGSQTLFSAEPSDSRKYVCVRGLFLPLRACHLTGALALVSFRSRRFKDKPAGDKSYQTRLKRCTCPYNNLEKKPSVNGKQVSELNESRKLEFVNMAATWAPAATENMSKIHVSGWTRAILTIYFNSRCRFAVV